MSIAKAFFTKELTDKILSKVLEQSLVIIILLGGSYGIVSFAVKEMDKRDTCNQEYLEYLKEQRKVDREERKEHMKIIERNNMLYQELMKKID